MWWLQAESFFILQIVLGRSMAVDLWQSRKSPGKKKWWNKTHVDTTATHCLPHIEHTCPPSFTGERVRGSSLLSTTAWASTGAAFNHCSQHRGKCSSDFETRKATAVTNQIPFLQWVEMERNHIHEPHKIKHQDSDINTGDKTIPPSNSTPGWGQCLTSSFVFQNLLPYHNCFLTCSEVFLLIPVPPHTDSGKEGIEHVRGVHRHPGIFSSICRHPLHHIL